MDASLIVAALLSAVLHAGWNAAIKVGDRPTQLMTAQMIVSAVLSLPILVWTGLPAGPAWPWIAASTALNLLTVTALLRSYELAGFGLAYPVVRALAVMLVVPSTVIWAGEPLSAAGLGGIALIALSLALLAARHAQADSALESAAKWILLAGLSAAAYVMCDAQGVRAGGSALAYGAMVSITNAAAMWIRQHGLALPLRTIASDVPRAIPIAIASVTSYLLILWVFGKAPIAPAAAIRDTSAVFALMIAVYWLREPLTLLRVIAVLLTAIAIPLLRLA